MRQICIYLKRVILLLFGGIIGGYILLSLAYLIPNSWISKNAIASSDTINSEGAYPSLTFNAVETQKDNFTDAVMLNITVYNSGQSPLLRSLDNKLIKYDRNYLNVTSRYLQGDESYTTEDYTRYWHGYVILLKPLLIFFNITEIRTIICLTCLMIIAIVIKKMIESDLKQYIAAYIILLVAICAPAIFNSMQFFTSFFTMNLGIWALLRLYSNRKDKIIYLFLIIGIIINYFDFLTYPLVTLGIPLVFYLLLLLRDNIPRLIIAKNLLLSCVSWGIGYAGMWIGKWAIASVVLRRNVFSEAIRSIIFRTGTEIESRFEYYLDALYKNLSCYDDVIQLIIVILSIWALVKIIKNYKNMRSSWNILLFIIPIMAMPFVWYFALVQHSTLHYWFTYRTFAISIMGWLVMCTYFISYKEPLKRKRGRKHEKK